MVVILISDRAKSSVSSISMLQMSAYASPSIAVYFLYGPMAIIQGIYATHFGISLAAIAAVVLVARIFDAITDPFIGYFSDKHHNLGFSRKPYVLAGGVLFIISSYFLYVPYGFDYQEIGGKPVSSVYFLICFLIFFFSWTLFEIPHLAWGAGLVSKSADKTRIFGLRVLGIQIAQILFFVVPMLPIFEYNEFTPQTLEWSVYISAALMLPFLYVCIRYVPDTSIKNKRCSASIDLTAIKGIFRNKPMFLFICSIFLLGVGVGMWFSLMFLYADRYLRMGLGLPAAYLVSFSISTVLMILWYRLSCMVEKKVVWIIGVIVMSIGIISSGFLSPNHEYWQLYLSMITTYAGLTAVNMMVPSFLSDIIDYTNWKNKVDLSATYFSIYTLVSKLNLAVGGAIGFAIADWYGFNAASDTNSSTAIFGLRLAVSWLPTMICFLSILFIMVNPITRARHTIVTRRLSQSTLSR